MSAPMPAQWWATDGYISQECDAAVVCKVVDSEWQVYGDMREDTPAETVAHLIAGAPQMYAALVAERALEAEFLARGSMGDAEYRARRKYISGLKTIALAKVESRS